MTELGFHNKFVTDLSQTVIKICENQFFFKKIDIGYKMVTNRLENCDGIVFLSQICDGFRIPSGICDRFVMDL